MKKILLLSSLFVFGLILTACSKVTNQVPNLSFTGDQVAIVSGHPDWKPVMYKDGDVIAGIGVDVVKEVFNDLGVKVESKYAGSRDVVQENAKNGLIDVIVALYKTKEREQYLDYSISYTNDPIVLFFNTGNTFVYDQKESLVDEKGIATLGDSYGQEIDDYILSAKLDIKRVETPKEAFEQLQKGEVDYFIYSFFAGQKVINELALTGIQESSIVSSQPFYIGISKKSPYVKYLDQINMSLQKMIAENKIPQI